MHTFRIDWTLPGHLTASGRPLDGTLIGPFPSAPAAMRQARRDHPGATLGAATQLADD